MAVRDIMIPRAQVDFIDINEPVETFVTRVIGTAHSRFPVIDQNRDDVIGVLLAKDLLRYYAGEEEFNVREMLRPAVFVPEAKRLNVLLREFRASRNHMAIVIDEYGGVAGLVTIEDVLEQIVGDIEDEYDFDEASDNILPEPGGRYRVKALTQIADFNAAFGSKLPEESADTVGGFLIAHPRAPAEARRVGGDRRPALPGAARRQPARLHAARRQAQDLSSFLAGAATVLAFAPAGVFPLAAATFAYLIHLWMHAPPRLCFWRGFWFGFGLYLAGVSWVYVSLHTFGGMPMPLAGVATVGLCAFLALFPPPRLAAGAHPGVEHGARLPADALAWVLFEWTLDWIFTGFPWMAIGYTSVGWPLQGYAPLGGVYCFRSPPRARRTAVDERAQPAQGRMRDGIVGILGLGQALAHGAMDQAERRADQRRAAAGNIEQEMKFNPQRYAGIFDSYARLAESTGAKLIVLPETALPRFYHRIDPAELARLEAAARSNGGDLLLGVPYAQGEGYYNSVLTLGVSPQQSYHKHHLVPFGEFIPPGFGWVLQILHIPLSDFGRGSAEQPPLAVAGQRVAVNICYEDVFGEEIRARAPPTHAARQHVERRLVRRLAGAGAAPADRAPAGDRDRAHAPHRAPIPASPRRSTATAACSGACRSSPRRASRSRHRATRE
jgi:apolipoprotein N-acyltransferase